MIMKLNIFNGAGSLIKTTIIRLIQFFPVYGLIFVAYGDRFLPYPLNSWSYNTRTTINQIMLGSFPDDKLENNKYNNKKSDQLIEDIEKKLVPAGDNFKYEDTGWDIDIIPTILSFVLCHWSFVFASILRFT